MTHTKTNSFKRPILALSMAASIALSPLAVTPAQAGGGGGGGGDHGRFLAGLVALGLIGVIIENEAGRRSGGGHYQDVYEHVPASKRLPARCVKSYNATHGTLSMVSKECLRDNFHHWRSMPQQCAVTVQYRSGFNHLHTKTAYRLPCLDNWGYHIVSDY